MSGALGQGVRLVSVSKRYVSREVSHAPGRPRRVVTTDALDHVDLSIAPGESVGLLGANGAGKTTLLRIVAGVTPPSEGRVEIAGPIVGLLGAFAGFQWAASARENAVLTAAYHGIPRRQSVARMDEVLGYADLREAADLPISRYSDGMRFRLGMSVALHLPFRVFVSDEALATADAQFRSRAHATLRAAQAEGAVLIVASHDPETIEALTDRSVRLERGRIVADGPTAEVLRGSGPPPA